MKQPTRNHKVKSKKVSSKNINRIKVHKKYGTSKLETIFATDILNKIGLKYIYQFKAIPIGRYYDFAILSNCNENPIICEENGIKSIQQIGNSYSVDFFIEVDGGYYHPDDKAIKEGKLNNMQKHNIKVDKIKDEWCAMNGFVLMRIKENDIRNNPIKVISDIEKICKKSLKKRNLIENRKKPH